MRSAAHLGAAEASPLLLQTAPEACRPSQHSLPRPIRHTCATLPLSRGHHPKLVQKLLGHASVAITLDRYSHVLPGMSDQTAAAMESALS
ncbi:MAG TPA: tyrosine-type recombinase/integrase [Rubrobacteraceae bacterium]